MTGNVISTLTPIVIDTEALAKFVIKKRSAKLDCNITISHIESKEGTSVFAIALFHIDGVTFLDSLTMELDTLDVPKLVTSGTIFSMVEDMYIDIQSQIKKAEVEQYGEPRLH